jgi:hypothetical protein
MPNTYGSRSLRTVVGLLSCMILVMAGAGVAKAADPPDYLSQFGPDGTESSSFGHAGSVAVDQQLHAAYVLDWESGSLFKFKSDSEAEPIAYGGSSLNLSGNELSGLSLIQGNRETQVAVDSSTHRIYVTADEGDAIQAFEGNGEPALFSAGPGSGTNKIQGFSKLIGIAVDGAGNIFASDNSGAIEIYSPSGEFITDFAVAEPANLAVDGNGTVYVARLNGTVIKYTPSEQPVTSSTTYTAASDPVSPAAAYSVGVDPATNDVYIVRAFPASGVEWYDESGILQAVFAQSGEDGALFAGTGVAIDGDSEQIFVSNFEAGGNSQVERFGEEPIQEGPPDTSGVAASNVTADSATLQANIDPNLSATSYRFEYGSADCALSVCASVPIDPAEVGAGAQALAVSQSAVGLLAHTTYHFRVVAENQFGTNLEPGVDGKEETDHVFTTQAAAAEFNLSDGRVWEMVSPANKHSGGIVGPYWGHVQAAEDGNALAYLSLGSIDVDPEGNRVIEPSNVLAQRSSSGWQSTDLTPPNDHVAPIPNGLKSEYKLFDSDLSKGLLEPISGTPLSNQASERTPYLRTSIAPSSYTPLVTGQEGYANVPSGTEFGGEAAIPIVRVQAASSNLSHVILRSSVPLAAGAPPTSLYEWSNGQLSVVNELPALEGGGMVAAETAGSGIGSVHHAVSEDGSRVFWSRGSYGVGFNDLTALYVRDIPSLETVRLDVAESGASDLGVSAPVFQGASADGTVVFFTDSHQLTVNASSNGRDLYRCQIAVLPASGCETLTDVSVSLSGSGESAEVLGLSRGMSEDGRTVYFVARGVLDSEPNGTGATPVPGAPNLYVWQEGAGTRFIATLSKGDSLDGATASVNVSAASSPNGRYFTFMSERSLTGYDNSVPAGGEYLQEIYTYDALSERLQCVSCDPTGAIPQGQYHKLGQSRLLVDPLAQWHDRWLAAVLPTPTLLQDGGITLYRPRTALDSGRVFFNSFDSLVPVDTNDEWDVYQYEPVGVGSCTLSSEGAGIARSGEGCVSLISSGTADGETGYIDASSIGDDAFFLTRGKLAALDRDDELDVYDARVGGVEASNPIVPECTGEECRPPSKEADLSLPASAEFQGHGNLSMKPGRRCSKGKHKVRRHGKVKCVPRKKRRDGHQSRGDRRVGS